nr:hypothetical protein CFP56_53509 [Quercus suber]
MREEYDEDKVATVVTIAWSIWANRNEVRHGGTKKTEEALVKWSAQYLTEYRSANGSTELVRRSQDPPIATLEVSPSEPIDRDAEASPIDRDASLNRCQTVTVAKPLPFRRQTVTVPIATPAKLQLASDRDDSDSALTGDASTLTGDASHSRRSQRRTHSRRHSQQSQRRSHSRRSLSPNPFTTIPFSTIPIRDADSHFSTILPFVVAFVRNW